MIFGRFWGQKIAIFQFLTLFQKITDFFENFEFFFQKKKKNVAQERTLRILIFSGGYFYGISGGLFLRIFTETGIRGVIVTRVAASSEPAW